MGLFLAPALDDLVGCFQRAVTEIPMATTQPDAIALLKADHRKVEGLFEQFEKTTKTDKKLALARQICTELTVHTIIEEEIFYPACNGKVEEDLLNESYVEHDGAKILISEIEASDPGQQFYDAKVTVLSEEIKHHVKEEERRSEGLFAQARAAGIDVGALGARMAARKKELLAQIKSSGLPNPETRSFTGHTVVQKSPIEHAAAA
jgi:hemerythrin superfamily protein